MNPHPARRGVMSSSTPEPSGGRRFDFSRVLFMTGRADTPNIHGDTTRGESESRFAPSALHLEVELDRHLHLAWISERAGDPAEGRRIRDARGREPVVHPVEDVEDLEPELQPLIAPRERPEQRHVRVFEAGAAYRVVAAVAVGPGRRNREGGDVEP